MYYLYDYMYLLIALIVCTVFSAFASAKVNAQFNKYSKVPCRSKMTGNETALRLLSAHNVNGISVGCIEGKLTDHYDPQKGIVNLSDSTYNSSSVAAVAVAAHETGHVMQKETGYSFYNFRTAIVPVVNFSSKLALPLVFIGILMNAFVSGTSSELGFYFAMVGVVLYGASFVFTLVTLPVEFDASRRAGIMLKEEGILTSDEQVMAKKVLSAAALTYVAAFLTSFVYFLRFLFYVLAAFGKRNNRR